MIFIVNNGGQYTHLIARALRDVGIKGKLVPNDISLDEAGEAEGLILSGGPSLENAGNSGTLAREADVPVLGICLGLQAIAKEFGGSVRPGEKGGYAEVEIDLIGNGLFDGLGDSTTVWASHADEVETVPDDFEITARSDVCDVEAMAHRDRPIYGVQFHPEVHHTADGGTMLKNFATLCGL